MLLRHTVTALIFSLAAVNAIDIPGQCTARPYSLTITGPAARDVTMTSYSTATLYLGCFAHLPVTSDPDCDDYLEDASIQLVRRASNTTFPISSWSGTSLHAAAYYFSDSDAFLLRFQIPSLPPRCRVTWWYDYYGNTATVRTSVNAPAPIAVDPPVIHVGEPVSLIYEAMGGYLDDTQVALVPFGRHCRSVTAGSATLRPVSSPLVSAAVGFTTTFSFQGEYLVCLNVSGVFREISYVYAYGGNPYFFKMEGLAGGGYYTLHRPYTIEFFGEGLNTLPGGDEAKLVDLEYDCTAPARGGVPIATNLGPTDRVGTNYSTWRLTITRPGSYRVCYHRSGAAWSAVPLFDDVPTDARGGPTVDPGHTGGPTTPLPSTTPYVTTAAPSTSVPTTAAPPTPTPCSAPPGCPLIAGGSVRVVAILNATEYPPAFASTLSDMMCLKNINPMRVQVTHGFLPNTLRAVVGLECDEESSWCRPVEPLSALMCLWELSREQPAGGPLRSSFDAIHVADMVTLTGAITANTSDTRLSPPAATPAITIIGASVATVVVVMSVALVAVVAVYLRCRRRRAAERSTRVHRVFTAQRVEPSAERPLPGQEDVDLDVDLDAGVSGVRAAKDVAAGSEGGYFEGSRFSEEDDGYGGSYPPTMADKEPVPVPHTPSASVQ